MSPLGLVTLPSRGARYGESSRASVDESAVPRGRRSSISRAYAPRASQGSTPLESWTCLFPKEMKGGWGAGTTRTAVAESVSRFFLHAPIIQRYLAINMASSRWRSCDGQ